MITTTDTQRVHHSITESLNKIEENSVELLFEPTQQVVAEVNEEHKLTNIIANTNKVEFDNAIASKLSNYCIQLSEIMQQKYSDNEAAEYFLELGNNKEKLLSIIKPILEKLKVYQQLSDAPNDKIKHNKIKPEEEIKKCISSTKEKKQKLEELKENEKKNDDDLKKKNGELTSIKESI